MAETGTINGATVIARALKQQGVDHMFGIVGFPVQGIAAAAWLQGELCDKVLESLKQWHRREMATALVDKGITELNGHRKNWATAKAPYAYVSAAYEGQRL